MNEIDSCKCSKNICVTGSALLSVSSVVFVPCFLCPLGVVMA